MEVEEFKVVPQDQFSEWTCEQTVDASSHEGCAEELWARVMKDERLVPKGHMQRQTDDCPVDCPVLQFLEEIAGISHRKNSKLLQRSNFRTGFVNRAWTTPFHEMVTLVLPSGDRLHGCSLN